MWRGWGEQSLTQSSWGGFAALEEMLIGLAIGLLARNEGGGHAVSENPVFKPVTGSSSKNKAIAH